MAARCLAVSTRAPSPSFRPATLARCRSYSTSRAGMSATCVDQAGGGGIVRHAAQRQVVEAGLGQGQAASHLERAHTGRAVAAGPGEHDTDGMLAVALAERSEEGRRSDSAATGVAPAAPA